MKLQIKTIYLHSGLSIFKKSSKERYQSEAKRIAKQTTEWLDEWLKKNCPKSKGWRKSKKYVTLTITSKDEFRGWIYGLDVAWKDGVRAN